MEYRGRIKAQCEKFEASEASEAWAKKETITKLEGLNLLVKLKIFNHAFMRIYFIFVNMQINIFVFYPTPQALDENIVQRPSILIYIFFEKK